jgi:hypothetical protein
VAIGGKNIIKKLLVVILVFLVAEFFAACRPKHETYVKLLSDHRDDTIITLGRGNYAGGYIAEEINRPGRIIFLAMEYPGYQKGDKLGVKIEELTGYSMHSTKVDASKFDVVDGKKIFRKYVDVPVYRVWELRTSGIGKD